MVTAGWLVGLAQESQAIQNHALLAAASLMVVVVLGLVNLPLLLVLGLMFTLIHVSSIWVLGLLASILAWLMWYGIVRFFEWRGAARRLIVLRL